MNQARILQAVGITFVSLLLGSLVVGLVMSYKGLSPLHLTNEQIIAYFLPIQVFGQFVMGFWLGRKVGGRASHLFSHVYLANIVLFILLVLFGFLVGQNAFWFTAFAPLVALILCIPSFPLALLVRRK
ncbi:hypothetical protein MK805_13150 [Shimazuella sp. AN120528]|uniref:hypothetical protein n=1 Tax=Shimazuella soli TaxID=1892854 RepID=UPI001F0FE2EA|nr:hypothetical protein [Shimazuella soli]MCH5585887.1 hypothetical protein [Shimazuella soli]